MDFDKLVLYVFETLHIVYARTPPRPVVGADAHVFRILDELHHDFRVIIVVSAPLLVAMDNHLDAVFAAYFVP